MVGLGLENTPKILKFSCRDSDSWAGAGWVEPGEALPASLLAGVGISVAFPGEMNLPQNRMVAAA